MRSLLVIFTVFILPFCNGFCAPEHQQTIILSEIQKSIQDDFGLQGEMRPITVKKEEELVVTPAKKKQVPTRGELFVKRKKEENRKRLALLRGNKGAKGLSGKEKVELMLKRNREKIKAMKAKKKNNRTSSRPKRLSIDSVRAWEKKSLKRVSSWEEEKMKLLKKWEIDQKRFLGMIPVYKENLVDIEADFASAQREVPPHKEAKPPRRILKQVKLSVFDDVHMVKGAFFSEVKDQGRRPTCAAFAGTRALEIVLAQNGRDRNLSEQYFYWSSKPKCQRSPCSKQGSWVLSGYRTSQKSSGFDIPSGDNCHYNPKAVGGNTTQIPLTSSCNQGVAKVDSFYQVDTLNQVLNALKNNHPVVGGFKLSKNFYRNKGYVFLNHKSAGGSLDGHAAGHAILLVGHMLLPKKLHRSEGRYCLIAANSWGIGWGKGGHACLSEKWLQKYRYSVPFIAVNGVKSI
ncbi:MAG: C1 family peptidase [Bacteriovoracaceae bacterium]|nr:C1 family peptidase [Bacteriovoracaceae bacterium]